MTPRGDRKRNVIGLIHAMLHGRRDAILKVILGGVEMSKVAGWLFDATANGPPDMISTGNGGNLSAVPHTFPAGFTARWQTRTLCVLTPFWRSSSCADT